MSNDASSEIGCQGVSMSNDVSSEIGCQGVCQCLMMSHQKLEAVVAYNADRLYVFMLCHCIQIA